MPINAFTAAMPQIHPLSGAIQAATFAPMPRVARNCPEWQKLQRAMLDDLVDSPAREQLRRCRGSAAARPRETTTLASLQTLV